MLNATEQADPKADIDSRRTFRTDRTIDSLTDHEGSPDVTYRIIETPVGALMLASTHRGLVRVAFECEGFDQVLEGLASKVGAHIVERSNRLDSATTEIEEYFAGKRTRFDIELDHRLSAGFKKLVQGSLIQIPYGDTASYTEVAERVGSPKAVRAVGTACATNPLPVVIPCHRVLRADGSLGGYIGGLDAKTVLLTLEKGA